MKDSLSPRAMAAAALAVSLGLVVAGPALAQTVGGGGAGNLGLMSPIWTYFQQNFAEGIILFGVAALGVALLFLHFHPYTVGKICAGAVVLANAVAIAGGFVTLGGGTAAVGG